MKSFYYNIDDAEFIDPAGEKIPRCVPELFYQEMAEWRIFLRDRENRPRDISSIVGWSAAVDCDYSGDSAPMCRTPSENITPDETAGAVTVRIDAATAEFLAAVNGSRQRRAFFELYGVNATGEREIHLGFDISARMILDPSPGTPQEVPETFATKLYVDLTVGNASAAVTETLGRELAERTTGDEARAIASAVVGSGGYVDSAGARAIASGAAQTAVSGAIFSNAEVDTQIGAYRITATSGGGLVVSGSGASVVLSGGQIAASAAGGDTLLLDSNGLSLNEEMIPTAIYVDEYYATKIHSSGNPAATSATIRGVEGGTYYTFNKPLTSLIVLGNDGATEASYIHFTLDSVTAPTPVVISGVSYLNEARFEGGKEYLLRFFDGMMEAREVLSPEEYPVYGSRGVFIEKNGTFTSSAMDMSDTVIVSGGTMHVFSRGAVSGCMTLSGGAMSLYGLGASVADVTVSSGGKFNITLDVDYDPADFSVIAGSQTNLASGTLYYQDSPFAGECVNGEFTGLSGTYRLAVESGVSAIAPVIGNSDTETTRLYVFSGGAVSGGAVGISGAVVVYGGTIDGVQIAGYAGEKVDGTVVVRGGTATNVAVSANGSLRVLDSGIAVAAVVESDGYLTVSSGGTVNSAVLNGQGRLAISSGGSAYETIINSDGKMYVSADASVVSTHISSGGIMYVSSGASVYGAFARSGGKVYIYNGAVALDVSPNGGTVYISYGGMVRSSILNSSGRLFVSSGGSASWVLIHSTGSTYLFPGGTANDIQIRNEGRLFVSSGGVASDVDVASGGSMRIQSGGTALAVNSRAGALITVSSGGYIEYVAP